MAELSLIDELRARGQVKPRPTIAELEAILASETAAIEILPNGEVRARNDLDERAATALEQALEALKPFEERAENVMQNFRKMNLAPPANYTVPVLLTDLRTARTVRQRILGETK